MSRVEALVERARARLHRLTPAEAYLAQEAGALLVDTRTEAQRARQGELPGALVIDRTVLEWRLDPSSDHCIPEARNQPQMVMICRQGFSSSLAAATLCELGVHATDVIGGVEAWLKSNLPLHDGPADVRE